MKNNVFLLSLIMELALLISCSSDDSDNFVTPDYSSRGERVAVTFSSPSICMMLTRATEVDFENKDAISISAVDSSWTKSTTLLSNGNYADNMKYESDGSQLVAKDLPISQFKHHPLKLVFYAVYPYKLHYTPQFYFEVRPNQIGHQNFTDSDLAMQKVSSSETNVGLSLKHMLCDVEITIKGDLNSKVISNPRLVNVCSKVLADQNTQTVETIDSIRLDKIYAGVLSKTDTTYSFHAIVAPQQIEKLQHFVTITVDGNDMELKAAETMTLVSGRRYRFAYTLNN